MTTNTPTTTPTTIPATAVAAPPVAAGLPAAFAAVLRQAPLARGDDRAAYEALLAQCAAAFDPRDMVEWIMVKDFADLTWEMLRLRPMKQHVVAVGRNDALHRIIYSTSVAADPRRDARDAMEQWNRGGRARERVRKLLAWHELDEDTIDAQALLVRSDSIDKIDAMIAAKEAMRRGVLRELEMHRESAAFRPRGPAPALDALDLVGLPPARPA